MALEWAAARGDGTKLKRMRWDGADDGGDSEEQKNFGKNGRMGVNFREFLRLGK